MMGRRLSEQQPSGNSSQASYAARATSEEKININGEFIQRYPSQPTLRTVSQHQAQLQSQLYAHPAVESGAGQLFMGRKPDGSYENIAAKSSFSEHPHGGYYHDIPHGGQLMARDGPRPFGWESQQSSQHSSQHSNASSAAMHESVPEQVLVSGDILDTLSDEQYRLYQSLSLSFATKNVKITVSTLRQIYTKQCRRFRIPNLLSVIVPKCDDPNVANNSFAFTLNCIQWSFGGKRSDGVDSFKYKMNKNIARWLLKEQQRKGIPLVLPHELSALAISVVQSILQSSAELDFCLDVLLAAHVSDPNEVLLASLQSGNAPANMALAQAVDEMMASNYGARGQHSMNSLVMDPRQGPQPMPPMGGMHMGSGMDLPRSYSNQSQGMRTLPRGPMAGSQDLWQPGLRDADNRTPLASLSMDSIPAGRREGYGGARDAVGGYGSQKEMGLYSQQMLPSHDANYDIRDMTLVGGGQGQRDRGVVPTQHRGMMFYEDPLEGREGQYPADRISPPQSNSSSFLSTAGSLPQDMGPSPSVVEQRLLHLLSLAPKGVLGAHIPAIYREEFNEPLRLHGRKLKDILLGTVI